MIVYDIQHYSLACYKDVKRKFGFTIAAYAIYYEILDFYFCTRFWLIILLHRIDENKSTGIIFHEI